MVVNQLASPLASDTEAHSLDFALHALSKANMATGKVDQDMLLLTLWHFKQRGDRHEACLADVKKGMAPRSLPR